ncbi:MAG: cobyrinate a,c-diamide synthase [Candidatus Rokuibacteriota bacterium]|nr:MAG: cobyrinate a,c-diamide synthase [Candidatus Rokubacteria bacterium]
MRPEDDAPRRSGGPRLLVIAGVSSGVGKTTITLGLLEAFRRRRLVAQAFKVGPDFIDPGLHAVVSGRPSYNLDGWMCSRDHVRETVARQAAGADLALVEGVMGCFDGFDGKSEDGSTAQIAKWLGAPVVLVVDAGTLARSAGAIVLGFERFDPALGLAAVIFNRVGGDRHAQWLADALEGACRAVPVGFLPRRDDLALAERHLGLVTGAEGVVTPALRDALARAIEEHVDLDRLLALAAPVETGRDESVTRSGQRRGVAAPRSARPQPKRVRLGVARDRAFQFYYPENLDRLRAAGADLIFWSPTEDTTLPEVDGLYIGGGYPELYARELAGNARMREAVRRFAAANRPVYAECGGLMYLAAVLEDAAGVAHPMVGVLPAAVRMRTGRLTLAYSEVELTADAPLGRAGAVARGHEFHCSALDPVPAAVPRVYRLRQRHGAGGRAEGYLVGRTLMSYVHLHFGSAPGVADALVAACAV